MPEFNEAFEAAVKHVIDRYMKPNVVAKVITVDKAKNTCDVEVTGSDTLIKSVNLLAVEANPTSKFVVYPKVNSLVTISYMFMNSDSAQVIKYSETEAIYLNGVQFGGLVKADVLKTELDKLKDYVSTLRNATKAVATVVDGIATGTGAAFETAMSGKTTGDFSGIKNDNVKHG